MSSSTSAVIYCGSGKRLSCRRACRCHPAGETALGQRPLILMNRDAFIDEWCQDEPEDAPEWPKREVWSIAEASSTRSTVSLTRNLFPAAIRHLLTRQRPHDTSRLSVQRKPSRQADAGNPGSLSAARRQVITSLRRMVGSLDHQAIGGPPLFPFFTFMLYM